MSAIDSRMLHDCDNIARHLSHTIGTCGCRTLPTSAVVQHDGLMVISQIRVDAVPSSNRTDESPQQHQSWSSLATNFVVNGRLVRSNPGHGAYSIPPR